jgi:hypothetical protein
VKKKKIEEMKKSCHDQMNSDQKHLAFSNIYEAALYFTFYITIIFPIWLIFLFPFCILSIGLSKLWLIITTENKKKRISKEMGIPNIVFNTSLNREYDLIVFGASGFTGMII